MKKLSKHLFPLFILIFSLIMSSVGVAAAKATDIQFSKKTDAKVSFGYTITRTATVTPKGLAVTYSSSNPDVAVVNSKGKVAGLKLGKSVITASAGGLKTSYNVTVVPAVKFSKSSDLTLTAGKTNTRKATVSPGGEASYKSSNPAVATVNSNGKVTAKSKGVAKITASYGGGSASYNVTVNSNPVSVKQPENSTVNDYDDYNNDDYNTDNYSNDDYRDNQSSRNTNSSVNTSRYAEQVVEIVNRNREKRGLGALEIDYGLMDAAQMRAEELVESYSHTRPDGSSCFTVMEGYGFPHAENIAMGQTSPSAVMTAWMNSSGHNRNIMNEDHTIIGVGCYSYNGRLYWVQLFAGS